MCYIFVPANVHFKILQIHSTNNWYFGIIGLFIYKIGNKKQKNFYPKRVCTTYLCL